MPSPALFLVLSLLPTSALNLFGGAVKKPGRGMLYQDITKTIGDSALAPFTASAGTTPARLLTPALCFLAQRRW